MFNRIESEVWAFDVEWVPDPDTGRAALGLHGAPDDIVVDHMWAEERSRSDRKDPRPFLPTPLCRVVAIAAVRRRKDKPLYLLSLPRNDEWDSEKGMVDRFLNGVEARKPQLVGWNSSVDVSILVHRAMRHGLSYPGLLPPDKPWEGRDYFSGKSSCHVDLLSDLFGWGRKSSLDEMAACVGVPGKLNVTGADVYDMWQEHRTEEIRDYCELDAVTTYLVWLRAAHFVGLVQDLTAEEQAVRKMLVEMAAGGQHPHIAKYVDAWDGLRLEDRSPT